MSQPYVGEIRMFGGNFAPSGWAFCNGQLMPISENETLFNLIGTTYGGDGQSTFALPDLQGRIPIHVGPGFAQAQLAGSESVTLTTQQIPNHNHFPLFTTSGQQLGPSSNTLLASAQSPQTFLQTYTTDTSALTTFAPQTGGTTGGSQPHDNMVPFLAVTFIISLFGIFPSQT
jgi:microcystin-dependent protein